MRWVKGQVCVVHTAGGETGCFPPLPCGPDAGDEEGTSLRGIEAGCFSKCIHAHCYFWLQQSCPWGPQISWSRQKLHFRGSLQGSPVSSCLPEQELGDHINAGQFASSNLQSSNPSSLLCPP